MIARDTILIVAPTGRDAEVAMQIMGSTAIETLVDRDGARLLEAIGAGEGAGAIVTDEGFARLDALKLQEALDRQPLWSDFPFVLLANKGEARDKARASDLMINMTVLERPCHPTSLVAAARALLRARARQRSAGRQMAELEATRIQLRHLADTLEAQVSDRTRDLAAANDRLISEIAEREQAEARLLQAQKMDALGQLTGGVAHDFNNLLTSVIGALELLLRKTSEPLTRQLGEIALSSSEKGANLIAQLLAFSRRQRLAPAAIDPNQIVEGMIEMLKRTLGNHIVVATRLADGVWHALADPTQLEVMILNLAINARDAMPNGGRILIETHNIDHLAPDLCEDLPRQDYVALMIEDTGIGMPPEIAARAFEPFFTTKEPGKGTGLGLSQLYGFAKQSGGTARIDSQPGRGTRVWLYLPRTQGPVHVVEPGTLCQDHQRRGRILVVDDDQNVQLVLKAMLQEMGYDVVLASHGAAALQIFDAGHVALVITDIAMPLMNGVELARQIRLVAPGTPILFATGYTDFKAFGAELSHEIIVRKPYHMAEIAERIDLALADAVN